MGMNVGLLTNLALGTGDSVQVTAPSSVSSILDLIVSCVMWDNVVIDNIERRSPAIASHVAFGMLSRLFPLPPSQPAMPWSAGSR